MSMIGSFGLLTPDQIAALSDDPDTVEDLIHPEDRDIYQDPLFHCVEKNWQGIHFVLNGQAWDGEPPLDFIVAGGTEVGDIDVGYGPARVFTPEQLTSIVRALAPISDEMLRSRFDADRMGKESVYPGWNADDVDGLIRSCRDLQAFLLTGDQRRLGLIVWCD